MSYCKHAYAMGLGVALLVLIKEGSGLFILKKEEDIGWGELKIRVD